MVPVPSQAPASVRSLTTTTTSAMTFVWDAPSKLNDCVFSAWWFTLSEVLEDGSLGSAFVPSGCEALTSICESICTATNLRPFTRYIAHVGVGCEDPRANSVESNSSTVPVTVSFSARDPRDLPGDPPSSAYIVAGVRTKPARVSAPTNVTITKAEGNSVLVEWTPGDGSLINCQFHSWLVVAFYGSRKVVSPPGCTVSELPIFDRTRRGCTAELDQCDVTVEFVVQELCVLPDADSASSRRSFPVRIEHGDDCLERAAPPTSLASASPTVNTLRFTWLVLHSEPSVPVATLPYLRTKWRVEVGPPVGSDRSVEAAIHGLVVYNDTNCTSVRRNVSETATGVVEGYLEVKFDTPTNISCIRLEHDAREDFSVALTYFDPSLRRFVVYYLFNNLHGGTSERKWTRGLAYPACYGVDVPSCSTYERCTISGLRCSWHHQGDRILPLPLSEASSQSPCHQDRVLRATASHTGFPAPDEDTDGEQSADLLGVSRPANISSDGSLIVDFGKEAITARPGFYQLCKCDVKVTATGCPISVEGLLGVGWPRNKYMTPAGTLLVLGPLARRAVFTAIRGLPFEAEISGYGLSHEDRILVATDRCGLGVAVRAFFNTDALGEPRNTSRADARDHELQKQVYLWEGRVQSFPGSYQLCYCSPLHSRTKCHHPDDFTIPVVVDHHTTGAHSGPSIKATVEVIGPYPDHRIMIVKGQPLLVEGVGGQGLSETTDHVLVAALCGEDASAAIPGLPNGGRSTGSSRNGSIFHFDTSTPVTAEVGAYALCWCRAQDPSVAVMHVQWQFYGSYRCLSTHHQLIETCATESVLYGAADEWYSEPGVSASSRPATNGGEAFRWESEQAGDHLKSKVDEYTMCWCSSFPQPSGGRLPCSLVVDYQAVVGTLIVAKPLGCSEATSHNDECVLQIPRSIVSEEGLALLRTETSACDDYTVEDAEELAGILLASRMELDAAGPTSHHCEPCPLGYYCPGEGEKRPCAPGLTTASTGAAYVEDCMCAPGRGTYKSEVANHSACPRGCFNREGLAAPIEGSTSEPGATGPLDCRCEEGYILSYAAGGERDPAPLTCVRCPLGMICQSRGKAFEGRIPMAVSYELLGMDDPEMVGGSENEGTNTATEKIMSVLSDLLCRAAVREGGATCFLEGVSARLPRRLLTTTLGGRRLLDAEPAIEVTARVVVSARVAAAVERSSVDGVEELAARLRDTSEDGVFDGLERITPLTAAPNTTAQELFEWFAGVDGGLLVSCPVGSLVPTGKAATSIQDCECGPGWVLVARRPSGGPLCDCCGFGSYRAGVSDTPNATCTPCSRNMVTRIDTAPSPEYCICRPGYHWDPELDACGRCPEGDICTLGGTSDYEIATVAEAPVYPASDASMLESCECAPGRKHVPIGDVLWEEGREKIRKYYKLRIVTGNGKDLAPYVKEDTVQILSTQGCTSFVDATTAEAVPVEASKRHSDDVSVTIVWTLSAPGSSAGCVRMARSVLGGPLGDGSVSSPWWARGYVELLGWTSYHCETSIAPCAYNWTPLGLWTYDKIKETLGRASSARVGVADAGLDSSALTHLADSAAAVDRHSAHVFLGAKEFTPYGFDNANSSDGRYRSPVVEACVVEEDLDIPSIRPPTTCKAHGQCLEGMRGFMCGACASGYWRDDVEKSCEECDTSWWARALYYLNIPWFLLVDSAQAVVIAKFTADAADDESRPIHSVIIKILGNYFVAIAPLGRFDFSKLKRYSRNPGMSTEVNIPSWSRAFFRKLIAVKDIDSPRQHIVEAGLWLLSPLFKIVFLTLVCGTLILMHKHLWRILMAIRGLRVKRDRTIKVVSKKIRRSLTRRRSSTASFSTRRSSLASLVPQSVDEVDVSSVDSSISEPTPIDVEALAASREGSSRLLGIWRTDYPTQSESRLRRALRTLCGFVNDSTPVYLVAAFYSWQRVTEKMLLLLQCNTFSDTMRGQHVKRLRWMTDPDVLCFEGSPHSTLVTIAALGLTTWTIGFVLLSMTLLFNNRKVLMEDHCLRKYGFLYLGFEIRCWYWESVKRVQAFLYGLITNISLGDMKAKLVCYAVLSGVSCILHVSVLPYDDREKGLLDALEAKSLFSIFITHITIQLILMFDLADEVVVFMILLCGFMNAAFILQAIYHLLKEYAFYYVRKCEKRTAEVEEARQESLRRRAIKEIKRSRRMARKRLERFLSLGGTLDESALRKAEDDSIIVDEKDIAEWIEQRRGLKPAAGSEESVQEKRPMPSSLLVTIKDLWARYYPPDAIMRYVKRLEDMKSRMGLQMEKPTDSIGQTAKMPTITTILIPKTPKNIIDRVRYALGGKQSTGGGQDLVVTSFDRDFFWTIQAETVAYITGRLEEASGGVENRSSLLDAGAYDFAMRVLFAYAHRLRKQDKPHLWGPDDAVRRVEEMRLGLRQFSLGRVSSLGMGAQSCGSFDVRNDLTLGELIVLPLVANAAEDSQQDLGGGGGERNTFTADELFRAHSIVITINATRMIEIYSLYCTYRSYRALAAQNRGRRRGSHGKHHVALASRGAIGERRDTVSARMGPSSYKASNPERRIRGPSQESRAAQ
ncbi:hypothetical protein FOZ60_010810 [Perkinsus olseni]|uniref:Uncharacterized protein n=1 Tax=Perkinsus olseni TaxID=32597 RepID=A0A7J6NER0_PEROL|nr:hypothetical protein FOZ60_010810 [Perkinsus olseni]